jgi:hypothetical protein
MLPIDSVLADLSVEGSCAQELSGDLGQEERRQTNHGRPL